MKTIILISSIFYILGLKISTKIDLIKQPSPVDKINIRAVKPITPKKTIHLNEIQAEIKSEDKDIDYKSLK